MALAYLLVRASDTIADTQILPVWIRLQGLEALRQRILGHSSVPLDFGEFAVGQDEEGEKARKEDFGASSQSPDPLVCPERVLLERIEEGLALLNQFSSADRELLRQVLDTIMSGQALDLTRFASANSLHIKSLETEQELDDYTYRVAGCVGEFWTRLCRARLFPKAQLDDVLLLANAVRFGKGLQLVNLLRDLPKDLREGRCYLPAEALQHFRLTPQA